MEEQVAIGMMRDWLRSYRRRRNLLDRFTREIATNDGMHSSARRNIAKRVGKNIKGSSNFYLAFVEATRPLDFDGLNEQAWELGKTENGGFGEAATRYAQGLEFAPDSSW